MDKAQESISSSSGSTVKRRDDMGVSKGGTRTNQQLTSMMDKAMKEQYGHLKLNEVDTVSQVGKTKPRTHTNPLSLRFATKNDEVNWTEVYSDPTKPLFIDLGCAAGRFGLSAASSEKWKSYNHLGLEIRDPLVERANVWAKELGLTNCHYIIESANMTLERVVSSYPGPIKIISVQFSDPHFKKKYHKRRIIQVPLLEVFARLLKLGETLFFQSDVEEICSEMRDRADLTGYFDRVGEYSPRSELIDKAKCAAGDVNELWTPDGIRLDKDKDGNRQDFGDWLLGDNPIGVPTEREVTNTVQGNPIFRVLYKRNATADPAVPENPLPVKLPPQHVIDEMTLKRSKLVEGRKKLAMEKAKSKEKPLEL